MHTARRKERSFTGNSARTSNHFSVMFFRKTRLLSRRCICIPQGARNEVLQESQPEPQLIFRRCFFRKTRKMSADVQTYFKRNLTQYSGNSARTSNHFSVMLFSQNKASKPPLYMHTARRKKRSFTGETQPETSNHFSVMFFRKTRKMSADVQAYSERNLTPYSGNSARTSAHFSAMFFRKTRKISDGVLSVLRAKFDAVLRKNSPKNQISIMSASFFFAISSISLTYLSVIF